MWSYFRSKASLDKALAVERCRRELAERESADARERLARVELEFARLRDQVLQKQGVIAAPLRTEPAPPPHPLVGVIAQLGITEWDGKTSASPNAFSEPAMTDD